MYLLYTSPHSFRCYQKWYWKKSLCIQNFSSMLYQSSVNIENIKNLNTIRRLKYSKYSTSLSVSQKKKRNRNENAAFLSTCFIFTEVFFLRVAQCSEMYCSNLGLDTLWTLHYKIFKRSFSHCFRAFMKGTLLLNCTLLLSTTSKVSKIIIWKIQYFGVQARSWARQPKD